MPHQDTFELLNFIFHLLVYQLMILKIFAKYVNTKYMFLTSGYKIVSIVSNASLFKSSIRESTTGITIRAKFKPYLN